MRLLIVEDNQRLQELLAEFLNRSGYRVDTAASVADFHASVATVQ
jgi:two-component system, OmpR family, response regulator